MNKNAILTFILLLLLIVPLASAQINVELEQYRIDTGLVEGEVREIFAEVLNDGQCSLNCFYLSPGFEEHVIDNLLPGQREEFMVKFNVPDCKDQCGVDVEVVCRVQEEDGCGGQEYNQMIGFDVANVVSSGSQLDEKGQSLEGQKDEGIEGIFGLVAVIFIILLAISLILLIFFGFWKWVKFLFFRGKKPVKEDDEGKRKLSAIMFTDMKGYSAEMGRDEEKTLKKVWRYEKAIKSIIKDYHGRTVKTIGDAIMGDFDSTVNAVSAAIAIQNLLRKEDISIRIGIHLGDVIHKAGDIFGEGVNIASRLESICEPGSIYISEDVYNQVRNKIKATFKNLGTKPLKNIESPPRVYKVDE